MSRISLRFAAGMSLVLSFAGASFANEQEDAAKAKLTKTFPRLTVSELREIPVKGQMYEVIAGENPMYYIPETGHLVFGQVWDDKGKNLSEEARVKIDGYKQKKMKAAYGEVAKSLGKAVKVGSGKKVVVEFTDPDCPYCRKMDSYWKTRDDVTRYVFLLPLPMHQGAPAKVRYILGADDQAEAFSKVYRGEFDKVPPPPPRDETVAKEQMEFHRVLAAKTGINGTPAFFVDGVFVNGADTNSIEKVIGKGKGN